MCVSRVSIALLVLLVSMPGLAAGASTERQVLAFYNPGYGTPGVSGEWRQWYPAGVGAASPGAAEETSPGTAHRPDELYDSHDPATLERHLKMAEASGIDALIADWTANGDFHDVTLTRLLHVAEKSSDRTQLAAHYRRLEPATIRQAVADLRHIAGHHGASSRYLKVDSRPVIFVHRDALQQLPPQDWERVIEYVNEKYPAVLLADSSEAVHAGIFGGLYRSDVAELAASGLDLGRIEGTLVHNARLQEKIACAAVAPGFQPAPTTRAALTLERRQGETYRAFWEAAMEADPDWVLVDSFNDWFRGTEIEPSRELGETWLNLTREMAERFRQWEAPESEDPMVFVNATVNLEEINSATRMQSVEWTDARTTSVTLSGYTGRQLGASPSGGSENRYFYFDVDDGFDISRGARVFVSYVDLAEGSMRIEYDSSDSSGDQTRAYKQSIRCPLSGDEHLREFMFYLPDALFAGRQPGLSDFRILFPEGNAALTAVRVVAPPPPVPPARKPTPSSPPDNGALPMQGQTINVQY